MICLLLVAAGNKSDAQLQDSYLDSLHTYAYLNHRLQACMQRFTIPGPARRRLEAAASLADILAKRWPSEYRGPDAFLPFWAAHPELDEHAAREHFGQKPPADKRCVADSAGYGSARMRLTALQRAAFQKEQGGDTLAALVFLDTIEREFPFAGTVFHAKQLAIASHDTEAYLRSLYKSRYSNFSQARAKEVRWPVATTAAQKAFVGASLQKADSTLMLSPRPEPKSLRRCLLSFADLHNISSDCIMAHSAVPPFAKTHKRRLRQIYCFLVEESYSKAPAVVCHYLSTPDSLAGASMRHINYLNLHLIQLNAFGQIYPDSLFENYFSFLQQLAYARVFDMEDLVSLRDEYLTAIRKKPSQFGYTAKRKGYDISYGIAPSATAKANREAMHLLPIEVASKQ